MSESAVEGGGGGRSPAQGKRELRAGHLEESWGAGGSCGET